MSEQDNQNPAPPRPTIKTSAVPLKKETVRITLRPQSSDEGAAPPPPPAPMAAAPPPPRPIAPTVPLAPAPRPMAPGAPPPPAGRPAPPPAPVGSKTIPLSQPPARPTSPMVGKPTAKIAGGAPTTQPLPRATVKLQQSTAPATASTPVSSVNIRTSAIEEDEEVNEGPLNIMGWLALAASIAALIGVLASWDKVDFFSEGVVNVDSGSGPAAVKSREDAIKDWKNAPAPEGFKLSRDFSPFDKKNDSGGIVSEYAQREPKNPERPSAP